MMLVLTQQPGRTRIGCGSYSDWHLYIRIAREQRQQAAINLPLSELYCMADLPCGFNLLPKR
jgi:hypothetical protein